MQVINIRIFKAVLFFIICFHFCYGQSVTDMELSQLADALATAVENQMSGQNIAVADFVDIDDQPSNLGKYLAEEFSYTLVNKATKFNVIDRTQLRRLMEEAGIGDKGMIDPKSVQKLGRLEGITAIVYGKLIPTGNTIKVYVKVVILEKQTNVITERGSITRTPTIDSFLGIENNSTDSNESNSAINKIESHSSNNGITPPYTNQNIQIALNGCKRNGNYVDCELQITSINNNDNFSLKSNKTRLADANGNSFYATLLSMNGKQSTVQVTQPLSTNTPVPALVRLANVPAHTNSFSLLELNCKSFTAFSFIAQLQNINIKP